MDSDASVPAAMDPAAGAIPSALVLLDKALTMQGPLVERHIARLRRIRPEATPAGIRKLLDAEFRAATISTGAGVGVAAAAPGVGTAAALALSGGEALGFLGATALYNLSRAELQGIPLNDIERRRTLVMAVMLGEAGSASVARVAERTGQHWARAIVSRIPQSQILAVNKVLGKNFVTKYGTKQGIIVLGRIIPFGIGAVIGGATNAALGQAIISSSNKAFGEIPKEWSAAVPPLES